MLLLTDAAQNWTCPADHAGNVLIPGVGVLQVTHGTTVKYLSAQLVSDAMNGFTTDITEALCVRVPAGDDALANPIFSIVGALDGQVYGFTSVSVHDASFPNQGWLNPNNDFVGIFSPTSFTPVGAIPEAVPPAYSQWVTAISHVDQPVESSIWSMTADAVPVLSAHWLNPPDWGDWQTPPYEYFVYSVADEYFIISADPNLSLWQPTFQMATITFVQSPCLSLPDTSPVAVPTETQS